MGNFMPTKLGSDAKKMCGVVLVALIVLELTPVDEVLNTNIKSRFSGQLQELVGHPIVQTVLAVSLAYLYSIKEMDCFVLLVLFMMLYR